MYCLYALFDAGISIVLFLFILVAKYYQASNREVKRLDVILTSFVYNNVKESLSGIDTVKIHYAELRFNDFNNQLINRTN